MPLCPSWIGSLIFLSFGDQPAHCFFFCFEGKGGGHFKVNLARKKFSRSFLWPNNGQISAKCQTLGSKMAKNYEFAEICGQNLAKRRLSSMLCA